jgi:hypothetical protein
MLSEAEAIPDEDTVDAEGDVEVVEDRLVHDRRRDGRIDPENNAGDDR